jgi:hypothetical protein
VHRDAVVARRCLVLLLVWLGCEYLDPMTTRPERAREAQHELPCRVVLCAWEAGGEQADQHRLLGVGLEGLERLGVWSFGRPAGGGHAQTITEAAQGRARAVREAPQ